jgi:hypothetical protein
MAYILHARSLEGELPRMVWIESTGLGDGVRVTVANTVGLLAVGFGSADELESLSSGMNTCICSGDIWLERTIDSHLWNVAITTAPQLGNISLSAFEFACAIQRVQLERLNLIGCPEQNMTAESPLDDEVRARQSLSAFRPPAFKP